MSFSRFRLPLTIAAFALAQSLCWGMTFNLPAITGMAMAEAFGLPYPAVMAGPTVMLVTMAAAAVPFLKLFERLGARSVMPASVGIGAAGLAVIATGSSAWAYFAGWLLVGCAGAGMLTTAIQIGLAEVAGARARQAIAALLVFGGLSTSICWPLLGGLQGALGWRTATLIGAMVMLLVAAPIYHSLLARRPSPGPGKAEARPVPPIDKVAFGLLAYSTAANGVVTWGFSLTIITLIEGRGVEHGMAVFIASFLGLAALMARLIDFVGGRRWNSLATALLAGGSLPLSFAVLIVGSGAPAAIVFIITYGVASGAMAVARSTLPLYLFPAAAYARASSLLALPLNLSFALAPPLFAAIISGPGSEAALGLATALSMSALVSMGLLVRRHRRHHSRPVTS